MALLQHEPPQDPSAQPWASLPLCAAGPEARARAPHHSPASSLLLLGPGDWNPSPQTSSLLHLARECAGASREGERWGLREQVPGWGWRHRLRLLPAKVRAVSERIRGPGHCPRSRPAGWVVTSWWVSQPWDCRQHGVGNSPPVDCRGGLQLLGATRGWGGRELSEGQGVGGHPGCTCMNQLLLQPVLKKAPCCGPRSALLLQGIGSTPGGLFLQDPKSGTPNWEGRARGT